MQSSKEKKEIRQAKNKLLKPIEPLPKSLTRQELIIQKAKELEKGDITANQFALELKLTDEQYKFVELYTSQDYLGDGELAAMQAYGIDPAEKKAAQKARAIAQRLLKHQGVLTLMNAMFSSLGWNDESVRKNHMFLMYQKADLKISAIMTKLYWEMTGALKKDQEITLKHVIDSSVYDYQEKIMLRNALYKGIGKPVTPIEDYTDFEEIKE